MISCPIWIASIVTSIVTSVCRLMLRIGLRGVIGRIDRLLGIGVSVTNEWNIDSALSSPLEVVHDSKETEHTCYDRDDYGRKPSNT